MVNCNNAYIRNIIILGSKMKKVLLDSVIVGKLNHDLRAKRNLELLERVNECRASPRFSN